MIFSCIIPTSEKDRRSKKFEDLIDSIRDQEFDQEQIETIVVTEGDSESAKAIGIRKARGEFCVMLCADNLIRDPFLFRKAYDQFRQYPEITGVYTRHYSYVPEDNSLNRYFSLTGVNDPLCIYLDKADRRPYTEYDKNQVLEIKHFKNSIPSLGDNGFFYRTSHILQANLDHYYPMDCAEDLRKLGLASYVVLNGDLLWHRTSESLSTFLTKRYRYAKDLYCDRKDRRWKMVSGGKDYWRLSLFILASVTIIEPLLRSIRGFISKNDRAWFWHPIVCLGFLYVYGALTCRNLIKHQSLFQRSTGQEALQNA